MARINSAFPPIFSKYLPSYLSENPQRNYDYACGFPQSSRTNLPDSSGFQFPSKLFIEVSKVKTKMQAGLTKYDRKIDEFLHAKFLSPKHKEF